MNWPLLFKKNLKKEESNCMNKPDKRGAKIVVILFTLAFLLCVTLSIIGFNKKQEFIGWFGIFYAISYALLTLATILQIKRESK